MPKLKSFLDPKAYGRFLGRKYDLWRAKHQPSFKGVTYVPPGTFYSPLLDLEVLRETTEHYPHDGAEYWEHIPLRATEQRQYYYELIRNTTRLSFPREKTAGFHYFIANSYFPQADAFTLSGIIQKETPRRIIEVGSGFSSAVMLDTLLQVPVADGQVHLTFIDPFPERLQSLLDDKDRAVCTLLDRPVQEVPLEIFDVLEAKDILFIDSSHVAKVGSDVTFLLLRILPRLKPGVLVHFHDVVYPDAYPMEWLRAGVAWNESLFVRAFLLYNQAYEIFAFNSFAGRTFPELFPNELSCFHKNAGGSLWLRKTG